MVKPSKLYERLVADSRRYARSGISSASWKRSASSLIASKAATEHYRHPSVPRPLTVQPRGHMAKPYQIDQFLDIVEEFGLKIGE